MDNSNIQIVTLIYNFYTRQTMPVRANI